MGVPRLKQTTRAGLTDESVRGRALQGLATKNHSEVSSRTTVAVTVDHLTPAVAQAGR